MKRLLILIIVLISCTQRNPVSSKSRLELVKDLPYRILNVSQDLKDQLLIQGHLIWEIVDSLDLNLAYLLKGDNKKIIELIKFSRSIEKLKNESYELWRKKDFDYTALVYQSVSINTDKQKNNQYFVIEIEHTDLTGTFYIFVPHDKIWDPERIKISYVDRN